MLWWLKRTRGEAGAQERPSHRCAGSGHTDNAGNHTPQSTTGRGALGETKIFIQRRQQRGNALSLRRGVHATVEVDGRGQVGLGLGEGLRPAAAAVAERRRSSFRPRPDPWRRIVADQHGAGRAATHAAYR